MRPTEAAAVLAACRHRGEWSWRFDAKLQRVVPEHWDRPEPAPYFTPFESVALAARLVAIGAARGPAGRPGQSG